VNKWAGSSSRRHYVVAGSALLQRQAAQMGYPQAHVVATRGMVIHPSFHDESKETRPIHGVVEQDGASDGARTALVFFGGCAPMRVLGIVRNLRATLPAVRVVVVCGKNAALQAKLEARGDLTVKSFIPAECVRHYMRTAALVLGKPGPGVVCLCPRRALAARRSSPSASVRCRKRSLFCAGSKRRRSASS
jgi:hypothetical protein